MQKKIYLIITVCFLIYTPLSSQEKKVYKKSTLEFLFALSDVEINGISQNTGLRSSVFFNYGRQRHLDITNHFGLYTGWYIHNIGFKVKENGVKDEYRNYSLGIPLALKMGSFDKHFYLYGGGEYEMAFHYRHKRKSDEGKDDLSAWFSSRSNRFMPSVFAGIQLPKGLNLRFTYYLNDFLNPGFSGTQFGDPVDYGQWKTQVFYFTISFNFKSKKYKDIIKKDEGELVSL